MSNPFENETGIFIVLCNGEGQYSLWPTIAPVPIGWTTEFGPNTRTACLDFVETTWKDMRPVSLISAMNARD